MERRDIDPAERGVYVRRAFKKGRPKGTKTEATSAPFHYRRSRSLLLSDCPGSRIYDLRHTFT